MLTTEMQPAGFLVVNKPRGMTSHDVIGLVRRLIGQKQVGHAGTLDPLAEGVLVVMVGKATRLSEFVMGSTKRYSASIVFGVETSTYDGEGEVVTASSRQVSLDEIESILPSFTGSLLQHPPAYSAIKVAGQPLYKLARRGQQVETTPRPVTVHNIEMLDWNPPILKLNLTVSPGTYIRSIAHDIGQTLGVGAYLGHLVRTASGRFNIQDSIDIDGLRLATELGYWRELLYPLDEGLRDYEAVIVDTAKTEACKTGTSWERRAIVAPETWVRAYHSDGNLIGLLQPSLGGEWQPRRVFV